MFGTVIEEVVESCGQRYGFADALHERQLPDSVSRILDAYGSFAHVIIVLILHVFASRENASAYSSAYPVILCEVMIVVETDVHGVLAGWGILVVDGVAVLVLCQLFVGVGVCEACRQTVVPSSLSSQFAATNTILAEIGIGEVRQLVRWSLKVRSCCRKFVGDVAVKNRSRNVSTEALKL